MIAMFRSKIAAAFLVGAGALGGASLAWACTAQPVMTVRSSTPGGDVSAPPEVTVASAGTSVIVDVSTPELIDGSTSVGAVEIRWNTLDGAVLANARGSSFSVPVQLPADAAPGVYSLLAVSRDRSGAVQTKASSAVQITALGAPAATASPWADRGRAVSTASSSGATGPFAAGIGLLALGLVALAVSFTVMSVRRRHVLAGSRRS